MARQWLCVVLVNYGAGERECGNTAALHHQNEDKPWSLLIPQLQVMKLPQHSIPIRTGGSQDQEQRKPLFTFLIFVMFKCCYYEQSDPSLVPEFLVLCSSSDLFRYPLFFWILWRYQMQCIVQFSHCIIKLQFCFSHSMELLFTSLNFATVDSTLICCHDTFITGNFFQIVFIMFLLAQTIYFYNYVFQQ